MNKKKKRIGLWLSLCVFLACSEVTFAQGSAQSPQKDTREKNVQEYIDLLRTTDVRQQKAEIMGAMMALDADQAEKFWPIYNEYNAELRKLNDSRIAAIREYARNYGRMNDDKADELMRKDLDYHKQRSELLAKYYGRVKTSLGAVQAARFLEIEEQLLSIIDLRTASELPIHG